MAYPYCVYTLPDGPNRHAIVYEHPDGYTGSQVTNAFPNAQLLIRWVNGKLRAGLTLPEILIDLDNCPAI